MGVLLFSPLLLTSRLLALRLPLRLLLSNFLQLLLRSLRQLLLLILIPLLTLLLLLLLFYLLRLRLILLLILHLLLLLQFLLLYRMAIRLDAIWRGSTFSAPQIRWTRPPLLKRGM